MFFTSYYISKKLNLYGRGKDRKHFFFNNNVFDLNSKKKICKFLKNIGVRLDLLVYSIASPRRYSYSATIKPTLNNIKIKHINTDLNCLSFIILNIASNQECTNTIKVMGGED
jgi:enoyl-[acyl-carrier protein] reductase / trans-2-enoyl-CoA reductase (NAD+)